MTERQPLLAMQPRFLITRWRDTGSVVPLALWAMGIVSFAYDLLRASRHDAWDLFPVWSAIRAFLHHQAPYSVHLFVYPPSVLLLLLPLGLVGFTVVQHVFLAVDAAAILVAAGMCLRLFGLRWRSPEAALLFFLLSLVLPVHDTLLTHNVNGLMLAGEAGALLAASRQRWLLAGVLLGVTFAIKPVLLPLLLLPLLWRKWAASGLAMAIPVFFSLAALPMIVHGGRFFTQTLPFLLNGNASAMQPFNVSLSGAVAMVGLPGAFGVGLRLLMLALVGMLLWLRWRAGGDATLRLVEVSGLILLATFLGFSFSWGYYSIYLLPLLVSVAHPHSQLRSWLTWAGVFFVGCPITFWPRLGPLGFTFTEVRITIGWLLILAAVAIGVWREARGAAAMERAGTNVVSAPA